MWKRGVLMLISDLIRLGRPILETGGLPGEIIELVSDINKLNTKNFFSNVLVIEVESAGNCVAHDPMQWGEYIKASEKAKRMIFEPDYSRVNALPFVWPTGGNPIKPQGAYGLPVYLTFKRNWEEIQKGAEGAESFLTERMRRTVGIKEVPKAQCIAETLHRGSQKVVVSTNPKENTLGLVALVGLWKDSPFCLWDSEPEPGDQNYVLVAPSKINPDKFIVADLLRTLELFWESKLAEGREKGENKNGLCSFCDEKNDLVSAYCKSWPWFTTTWGCPLPMELKEKELVKSIAMCPKCYKSMVYGAAVFEKLTRPLENFLIKEIFSPVSSPGGRESAGRGKSTPIYGCGYVLPILDKPDNKALPSEDFAESLFLMMEEKIDKRGKEAAHIKAITGFEACLPEGFDSQDFLMNLIYFSGDTSRGDIHLRAKIEDILPSTLSRLSDLSREVVDYYEIAAKRIFSKRSDKDASFMRNCYFSIPWMLTNAYGGSYIWDSLQKVVHHRPLSRKRFISNTARRMTDLSIKIPDGYALRKLKEEVLFYLVFSRFLYRYDQEILDIGRKAGMRDWKDIARLFESEEDLSGEILTDYEELGFAAGWLVRSFSNQYWHESGGKDFIKHRVMTFGSRIKPETLWKRALVPMNEIALQRDIHMTKVTKKLLALILLEFGKFKEDVRNKEDDFMSAFWSGYILNN